MCKNNPIKIEFDGNTNDIIGKIINLHANKGDKFKSYKTWICMVFEQIEKMTVNDLENS